MQNISLRFEGTQDAWAIKRYAAMDTGLSEDDMSFIPSAWAGVLVVVNITR